MNSNEHNGVSHKAQFPFWFRIFYAISSPVALSFICVILFKKSNVDNLDSITIIMDAFLLLIVIMGFRFTPIVFSTIYAKKTGILKRGLFGSCVEFSWADIETVRRPRFHIPVDAIYIIAKKRQRITLARSMSGCNELLSLIQSEHSNLIAKDLLLDSKPSSVTDIVRRIVIWIAIFIAYLIIRKIYSWYW